MDRGRLEEYHATRDYPDKAFRSACYAPHVSMYFDTLGNVLACCQNSKYPMGNVSNQRLPDIWHGDRSRKLRKALQKDSFGAGCQFCEWQISVGNYLNAFTRNFDRFAVESPEPDWPRMMEFSVSNTCNLECVMCYGVLSSSIRARREGLPPLPKAYDDQFFEDLRPFLHHLEFAKFLGGEPFLAAESFRIWDLMHEEGVSFHCNVTTNGTQWNERVERVLERFPISICLSMDGATKETVERIRVNAKFESVRENFKRFHSYCRQRELPLVLTYCLMPQNWHEFGDYLLFAEEWSCPVGVNLVYEPPHCSLYTLPTEELDRIATALEKQSDTILAQLKINRHVWIEQVSAIRRRVENAVESSRSPFQTPLALIVINKSDSETKVNTLPVEEGLNRLRNAVGHHTPIERFICDKDDKIESFDGQDSFFGLQAADCVGHPFSEVITKIAERTGTLRIVPSYVNYDFVDRVLLFHHPTGELSGLRVISVPRVNEFGLSSGSLGFAASFQLSKETQSHDEAQIRSLLGKWDADALVSRLALDNAGKLAELPAVSEPLEGLNEHLRVGMTDAEFLVACRKVWGLPENLRLSASNEFDDQVYRFNQKNQLIILRLLTIPRFHEDGKHDGYWRFLSISKIDATKGALSEVRAQEQIAEWTGHDKTMRIIFNRTDVATEVDIAPEGLAELDEASCLGKSVEQISVGLEGHFGAKRNVYYEQSAFQLDVIDEYPSTRGYSKIRSVAVPKFNSAGNYIGTCRYYGILRFGHPEFVQLELASIESLKTWSGSTSILKLHEDAHGAVSEVSCLDESFLGIPVNTFRGLTQEGLQSKLTESLGNMTVRAIETKAIELDVTLDFCKTESMAVLRVVRLPKIDPSGAFNGMSILMAGWVFDSAIAKEHERLAREAIASWSADAQIIRVQESLDRRIISFEGALDAAIDIPFGDYIDRPFEEFSAECAKRIGPHKITSWKQSARGNDIIVEVVNPGAISRIRFITIQAQGQKGQTGYIHLMAIEKG